MTGSFSQTAPERLPATKQVETWTSAGRFIRRAKAMTFCVPTTFVRSPLSSVIESYVAGGVDDDVDVAGDRLCFFFGIAKVCLGNVAAPNDYLIVDEPFERAAVTFAQWIERRRSDDIVPKSILRLFLRTRAHGEIDLAYVRK